MTARRPGLATPPWYHPHKLLREARYTPGELNNKLMSAIYVDTPSSGPASPVRWRQGDLAPGVPLGLSRKTAKPQNRKTAKNIVSWH